MLLNTVRLAVAGLLAWSVTGCQTAFDENQVHADRAISEPVPIQIPVEPPEIFPEVSILEPPDLWHRIRANFALDHHLEQKRVQAEICWLKRHPQYLINLRPRMEKYLAYISEQVGARGYPGEIALLPIVESALDPFAFSPGGAAGLWQFIPATAKRFRLQRDWWQDQRRDPIASTEAALQYLHRLHERFDDWYLALAGYNAGEGSVMRAKRRAPKGASFWVLKVPRETSAYVPRLLAMAAVVTDPERYGLRLPSIGPEIPFTALTTHDQFDLMKAAEVLELDVETLYQWNPSLNQWATPPNGPHRLLVPTELINDGQARLDRVADDERVQWLRVKINRGDTLSQIATLYNTDVSTLKRVNKLSSHRIRAGNALYIPKSSAAMQRYPIAVRTQTATYSVKPGDSLWSISRSFNVALNPLMRLNHVGPKDVLRVGQQIYIPGTTREVIRTVRYRVRKGDSLARIASKFAVTIADIAAWNQLDVNRYLQPGQPLKLHVNVAAGED